MNNLEFSHLLTNLKIFNYLKFKFRPNKVLLACVSLLDLFSDFRGSNVILRLSSGRIGNLKPMKACRLE